MSPIPIEVTIDGPVEQVFDLITQTRFWPQWHLLTRAVAGTTERPFLPGDKFNEFVRTANGALEVEWEVLDYERPHKASIKSTTGIVISYTFEKVPKGTLFKRVLVTDPKTGTITTGDTEKQSVANLKALVESIIHNEHKGQNYP